jgi:hypothetical protein
MVRLIKGIRRCGVEIDEIPELPTFIKDEIFDVEVSFEEFKNAKNRLIMYEIDGEYRIRFDKLNAELYACLVAKISQPVNEKLWEFLKLSLEGIRLVRKEHKKSIEMAVKIERHFNQQKTNNQS